MAFKSDFPYLLKDADWWINIHSKEKNNSTIFI